MMNRFETYFCCLLCIFNCQTIPILRTFGQFENLVFVIMSTRENIRLIARNSLWLCQKMCDALRYLLDNVFIKFGSKLYVPFLGREVPRSPSYGVYFSQPICLERICSNVSDVIDRNRFLTAKVLNKTIHFLKHLLNSTTDTQN